MVVAEHVLFLNAPSKKHTRTLKFAKRQTMFKHTEEIMVGETILTVFSGKMAGFCRQEINLTRENQTVVEWCLPEEEVD